MGYARHQTYRNVNQIKRFVLSIISKEKCLEKTNSKKSFFYINLFCYIAVRILYKNKNIILMLAIVEIAGQQFNVEQSSKLTVNRLDGKVGDTVELNNILAVTAGNNTQVGTPFLKGSVMATIIEHGKGEKVRVFHKKRRKGYRKLRGFRPSFTTIEINSINI